MSSVNKVVLFGRTGDGKSTVANVLVTGGIDIPMVFPSSDAPTGCTSEIKTASGRGWTVTDTIGLGEADSGTKSNEEAKKQLTGFLKKVKAEYSHIIFVRRAGRVTQLDEMIWLLFTSIFEGAEEAFVILFTEANEQWLVDNETELPAYMANYDKFVVDFPPMSDFHQPVRERKNKEKRGKSLHNLEENLLQHFARRGNKPSVPLIAKMNDAELEEKSSTLMQKVVDFIRRCFDPEDWMKVASKISSFIDVVDVFSNLVQDFRDVVA